MRHDMVDHRRRYHASPGPAGGAQRVPRQEGGAGPAPARTVASARCARPLPVQRLLYLRRAEHPCRTVHGRLDGQRRLRKAKPAAVVPGGLSRHTLRVYPQTISCESHCQTTNDVLCSNSNLLQARQTRSSALLNSTTALRTESRPRRAVSPRPGVARSRHQASGISARASAKPAAAGARVWTATRRGRARRLMPTPPERRTRRTVRL